MRENFFLFFFFHVSKYVFIFPIPVPASAPLSIINTISRFIVFCNKTATLTQNKSGGSRHNFQLGIVWIRCPPPEALWRYMKDSAQAAQHPYPPPHQQQQQQQPLLLEGPRPAAAPASGLSHRSVAFTFGASAASGGSGDGGGLVQRYNQPPDGFAAKWERQVRFAVRNVSTREGCPYVRCWDGIMLRYRGGGGISGRFIP